MMLIRIARSLPAAGKPAQGKEYGPAGKFLWIAGIIAVAVAMFGWQPVLWVLGGGAVLTIAIAAAVIGSQGRGKKATADEDLERLMNAWRENR